MKEYQQQVLDRLVTCAKEINRPPKREMLLERGSWRNDMDLKSMDGNEFFEVFLRKADAFPENFSIGLVWCPREDPERVCLIRCNGPHGEFRVDSSTPGPHYGHHVHLATAAAIAAGEKPERGGQVTTAFASFEEAIVYFINHCHIVKAGDHFPHAKPAPLFDKPGERQ